MNRSHLYDVFIGWWNQLRENNGGRARLKRCGSPDEAVMLPETHALKSRIPGRVPLEAVATLAGISAHIKNDSEVPFARALATPRESKGRVPYSDIRFRQLLSCRDWNELYQALRRAVSVLDGTVSLKSFLETVLLWNDEFRGMDKKAGSGLKYRLSRDYYETLLNTKQ